MAAMELPLVTASAMPVAAAVAVPIQQQFFTVALPEGAIPGQQMQASSPDGQLVQFMVPEGVTPGQSMQVPYTPKAAANAVEAVVVPTNPQASPSSGSSGGFMGAVNNLWESGGYIDPGVGLSMTRPGQQVMGQKRPSFNCPAMQEGEAVAPFERLAQANQIRLRQQVNLAEVLVGFTMANKYLITDIATNQDLLIAGESNNGMMGMLGRQVFEGGFRPFDMNIGLLTGPDSPPVNFVHLDRPFRCTCCCFQRPELTVTNSLTNRTVGSITDPFSCCHFSFKVHDSEGQEIMYVREPACQPAFCCWGCPCGCQELNFSVIDSATDSEVATMKKEFNMADAMGMVTGVDIQADQYMLDFKDVRHPEWRAMLIGLALFLDYNFFNSGGQKAREQSVAGQLLDIAN